MVLNYILHLLFVYLYLRVARGRWTILVKLIINDTHNLVGKVSSLHCDDTYKKSTGKL